MSYKEIVTLQVGHYSNFVGTHWWNQQESSFVYKTSQLSGSREVCHDVLFREGENRHKEITFTPRMVAFDLKGSLKTLKQDGTLYDIGQEGEEIKWLGDVTMHKEEGLSRNSFLRNLDSESGLDNDDFDSSKDISDEDKPEDAVRKEKKTETTDEVITDSADATLNHKLYDLAKSVSVWSDFLRVHQHPKSMHIVEEYRHNDELRPFDLFNCADEVLANYNSTCEWEDRLHRFVEECDNLQGFHVLMDTHDGFGGLGAGLLCYLEDDYPGKGILTFGFTPSDLPDDTAQVRSARIINSALAYDKACMHSSLFVPASLAKGLWRSLESPVSFPNMSYKSIPYHTSAILASALDTLSLPYRLDAGAIHLRDITHSLNVQGRKMASLNTSMPLGLHSNESLIDFFSGYGDSFPWQPLTPHMKQEKVPLIQSVVMRGISNKQVETATDKRKLPAHLSCSKSANEVLINYMAHRCSGKLFTTNCLETPLKTGIPYPHIFKDTVTKTGYSSSDKRAEDVGVESIPMITSLQCNTGVGGVIEQLHGAAAKMNMKKHHRYLELGMEEDDYIDTLENLHKMVSNYTTETVGL